MGALVRLRLPTREMAAARPLLALLLLLGAVLAVQGRRHARYFTTSSNQRELLKEAGNEIDHGPVGYTSQHKQHRWQKTGHKGHVWANKFKGGLKKRRFGHPGEHQPANTAFDHDNINLQRLDSLPVTKKKSLQKPSKKMDKMYKKMLEKQRLQKKREKYEKLHKKAKKQVP